MPKNLKSTPCAYQESRGLRQCFCTNKFFYASVAPIAHTLACSACLSLSNMNNNVNGKMRIGREVSSLRLFPDMLVDDDDLADVS